MFGEKLIMERYKFNKTELQNMESSPIPFAIYQFIDKRAVTLVLSDGFCKLYGYSREELYNLLDNAIKFAAPGSCLLVRLYKDMGKAYVSIKDYGETIPPDDLPYIFDRFHKSDRSRSLDKEGVGLGLYLVKTIINAHDEDIAVRSEDGMTEFVFTLTLAENMK